MQKSNRCGSNKDCFFILQSALVICFGFGRAVSRILSAPCGGENHLSVQPIPGIHPLSRKWSGQLRDSLFGLAPDGVFRAASLALRAVVSYTTFSPLPAALAKHRRFDFLWHCPSEGLSTFRPRISQSIRTWVTRHRALWCSDFPLPARAGSDSPPFQNQHEYKLKK